MAGARGSGSTTPLGGPSACAKNGGLHQDAEPCGKNSLSRKAIPARAAQVMIHIVSATNANLWICPPGHKLSMAIFSATSSIDLAFIHKSK